MTRILVRPFLYLLLALLLLSACTTTHRNAAAMTLCIAGFAADVALSIHGGPMAGPGGILGLLVCDVGQAAIGAESFGEAAGPQLVAREESPR